MINGLLLGLAVILFAVELAREIHNRINERGNKPKIPKWVGFALMVLYFFCSFTYIVIANTRPAGKSSQYIFIFQQRGWIEQNDAFYTIPLSRPRSPDEEHTQDKSGISTNDPDMTEEQKIHSLLGKQAFSEEGGGKKQIQAVIIPPPN